jgi:hypothetical protein
VSSLLEIDDMRLVVKFGEKKRNSDREYEGSMTKQGAVLTGRPSEPPSPLEPNKRDHSAQRNHGQSERIAAHPVQLRHILEVHAIDSSY